jgi:hypothetical protein
MLLAPELQTTIDMLIGNENRFIFRFHILQYKNKIVNSFIELTKVTTSTEWICVM